MSTDYNPRVWPKNAPAAPPLVAFGFLTVTSILAVFMVLRARSILVKCNLVRVVVFLILFNAFFFVYAMAILVLGVGTSARSFGSGSPACAIGIWWCVIVYASAKLLITAFLNERVYLVHSVTNGARLTRWKSKWYLAGCVMIGLWLAEAVVLITGRYNEVRSSDGACMIGVKLYSTVACLAIDVLTNAFLTTAFIVPIYRSKFARARRLARNSCIAAIAALATTFANMAVLSVLHGKELAWVCLGSCSLDVAMNSAIIFFITSRSKDDSGCETESRATNHRYSNAGMVTTLVGGTKPPLSQSKYSISSSGGITVSSEVMRAVDPYLDEPPMSLRKESLVGRHSYRVTLPNSTPAILETESTLAPFENKTTPKMTSFGSILESPVEGEADCEEEGRFHSCTSEPEGDNHHFV